MPTDYGYVEITGRNLRYKVPPSSTRWISRCDDAFRPEPMELLAHRGKRHPLGAPDTVDRSRHCPPLCFFRPELHRLARFRETAGPPVSSAAKLYAAACGKLGANSAGSTRIRLGPTDRLLPMS